MINNGCIDAGREGCPCALAVGGKCIACPKLMANSRDGANGSVCDDCNWQGSCIYSLYEQNGRSLVKAREGRTMEIMEIRQYEENFKVFILAADFGFCQKARTAGAYVFVRKPEADQWYETPISILKAEPERGRIHLAVCSCGPKSRGLMTAENALFVRGMYYNALSGMGSLADDPESCLVYAKGIAAAPLCNLLDGGTRYTKWLQNLNLYIDVDKIGHDFLQDYFGDLPAEAVHVSDFRGEGLPIDGGGSGSGNIFALTSPYYAKLIQEKYGRQIVRPNEGNMCCGEGVCGACTFDDEEGKTIHRCKERR